MYGAGPAGDHQDEFPGVITPFHGHHAQRRRHVVVHQLVNAVCRRDRVHGQGLCNVFVNCRTRGPGIELQFAFFKIGRVQVAQYVLRIGDGGQGAAAAVAGRPRRCAGAFRTHCQQSAPVDPGDGTAPGADGVNIQDG